MNEQQIKQSLQQIAAQDIPATLNLWPSIRARVRSDARPACWTRVQPTTRLSWAVLVVLVFFAVSTGAYATSTIVSQLFHTDAGLEYIDVTGLSHEINQSQTVDGVTVTLYRAYADAYRLVVGFIVHAPEGKRYIVTPTELVGTNGTTFSYQTAHGINIVPETVHVPLALPSGESGMVYSFDTASISGAPTALSLRLTIEADDERRDHAGHPIGPFVFDFSVPFTPGRTVDVEQTKQVDGRTATLKRVTVAPSGTQAIVCLDPLPQGTDWTFDAEIRTNDGQRIGGNGAAAIEGGCHAIKFDNAFAGKSGSWTMTVRTLEGTSNQWTMKKKGPWTWTFEVPQP